MEINEIQLEELDVGQFVEDKVKGVRYSVGNDLAVNVLSSGVDSYRCKKEFLNAMEDIADPGKKNGSYYSEYLVSGFPSSINVIVLMPILQLPTITVKLIFFSSYTSEIVFGGYLCRQVFKALQQNLKSIS
ncbi:MAG: hypothetical protein ABSB40_00585 [Nitrososphaeria archaeon]|jgi:GMP synthase PP-ATPase subunit